MKTEAAINLAGSASALAALLEITPSAVSQWGDDVPQTRHWQLRVLRPEWFADSPDESNLTIRSAGRRSTDTTEA